MNQILLDFVEEWTSKNENLTPSGSGKGGE
jgi:hypothetical protein